MHFDIYNDYLAIAGYNHDSSLTGKSYPTPYLAMASISKGEKFYWAKTLSLKGHSAFYGA
jgi:hypothetical protein